MPIIECDKVLPSPSPLQCAALTGASRNDGETADANVCHADSDDHVPEARACTAAAHAASKAVASAEIPSPLPLPLPLPLPPPSLDALVSPALATGSSSRLFARYRGSPGLRMR